MYCLREYIDDELKTITLSDFLKVQKGDIISFGGAGGKTSTIMALSNEIKENTSYRILISTTTKMYLPKNAIVEKSIAIIAKELDKNQLVIAGEKIAKINKMGSFPLEFLENITKIGDITLLEADGSKRLPFKMPRQGEPVYLNKSNKIVYLIGMNCMDMKLQDLCRGELISQFLHKYPADKLSEEDIIKIILSEQGAKKAVEDRDFFVILNQVDDDNREIFAKKIVRVLTENNVKVALCKHYKI